MPSRWTRLLSASSYYVSFPQFFSDKLPKSFWRQHWWQYNLQQSWLLSCLLCSFGLWIEHTLWSFVFFHVFWDCFQPLNVNPPQFSLFSREFLEVFEPFSFGFRSWCIAQDPSKLQHLACFRWHSPSILKRISRAVAFSSTFIWPHSRICRHLAWYW